jgi:hypothetical protein
MHDAHFNNRTRDEDWCPVVAERGWIALSHNRKMRYKKIERDAIFRSGLAMFYLIGENYIELQRNLVATLPRIVWFREKYEPPFIAHVTRPGKKIIVGSRAGEVKMMLNNRQWIERLAEEGDP